MDSESLLLCLQEIAICHYHEPVESPTISRSILVLLSYLRLDLLSGIFP